MPRLDFAHPQVVAAMKVTGIQEEDLTSPPPPLRLAQSARLQISDQAATGGGDKSGSNTARERALATSKELWERKQRQLLQTVEEIASHLDEANVEQILHPTQIDEEKMAEQYSKHQKVVETMRRRNEAQLQREAGREITSKAAKEEGANKMDALEKRMAEQAAETREAMKLEADKRKAKLAKAQETVKQVKKADWQKQKDSVVKQKEKGEAITKREEEKKVSHEQHRAEKAEKRDHFQDLVRQHEQATFERKVQRYESDQQKDKDLAERLQRQQQERREELQERQYKFAGKVQQAIEEQLQQEANRNNNFLERVTKVDKAREMAVANRNETVEAIKARREKELTKWGTNRLHIQQERKEKHVGRKKANAEGQEKAEANRDRYLEEQLLARSGNRGLLLDVVDQNRSRNQRAEEHAMNQALAKIERDALKKDTDKLQREQVQAYRGEVIKDFMHGRQRVEELRRIDPQKGESSKKRVNDMLREFNMAPLKEGKPKEGEEGEQQK